LISKRQADGGLFAATEAIQGQSFYLEWLLVDPAAFLKSFHHDGPETLEEYRRTRASRLPIIEKAVNLNSQPEMFNAEHIDEIRYDRTRGYELAAPWDQANHLINTFAAIRTSPQSFNFVFLDPMGEGRWEFLYTQLPMLLYYAVEVIEALLARLLPDPELMRDSSTTRRMLGFQLWTDSLGIQELTEEEIAIKLPECPRCGMPVIMDKANMMLYFTELKCICQNCGAIIDADGDVPS
jgi:hypothetical protein